MPNRRLGVVMAVVATIALAVLSYVAVQFRTGVMFGPGDHHASAPALTASHLRTVETSLMIALPSGSTLRHASLLGGKDSCFYALITAPASSISSWTGPPPGTFRLEDPTEASGPDPELPWARRSFPQARSLWRDQHRTDIWLSHADGNGVVFIYIACSDGPSHLPPGLYSIFAAK